MSDLVTSRIFVDGEKGITAAKLNDIVASSVIQPAFYTSKPTASTADPPDVMLLLKSGAYAQVPVSTLANSISSSQIWSTRLRSFNAIGNSSLECDQRTVGAGTSTPGAFAQDRWSYNKAGTSAATGAQIAAGGAGYITLPGTNFAITSKILRVTLTTAQATLGVTDQLNIYQIIEGVKLRELIGDVHSLSILVRSSVANLTFGLAIRDGNNTHSLVNLCTLGAANTWALIQLPNIPVFVSGGSWAVGPGVTGYSLVINLAAGSTLTAPANGTWQNGNFIGAAGQMNFAAQVVNSTFDVAFVQHEPGALCTTPIDCPFTQNLDECLRYFAKSYDYDVAVGTANAVGDVALAQQSTAGVYGTVRFPKLMAKIPTCTAYNPVTGAANSTRLIAGTDYAVTAFANVGKGGFDNFATATMPAPVAGATVKIHYTADTGL